MIIIKLVSKSRFKILLYGNDDISDNPSGPALRFRHKGGTHLFHFYESNYVNQNLLHKFNMVMKL